VIRLKRRKAKKSGLNPSTIIKCSSHLKWVRGHECAIADKHDCKDKIEAAHVRRGSDGYMGGKPSDTYAIPLDAPLNREELRRYRLACRPCIHQYLAERARLQFCPYSHACRQWRTRGL